MTTLIKIVLVALVFTIEIRVKAGIVFREPKACEQDTSIECLLFTNKIGSKINTEQATFYLGHDTLLFRDLDRNWHLIRGTVRVKAERIFSLYTIAGYFEAQASEYLMQQNDKQSNLFVLRGQVKAILKSPVNSPYALTEGYWNWYGPINALGLNDQGMPKALTWKRFSTQIGFENWYLIIKDKANVKQNEFMSVENASHFYLDLIQSIENLRHDKQVAEENRQKAVEAEKNEVRRLYRKKFEIETLDE